MIPPPGGPFSGPPPGPVPVPEAVRDLAEGFTAHPVWLNETGGLTFRLDAPTERRYVKWAPAGSGPDLAAEAERLAWAADTTPVPRVLGHGADGTGAWLLTAALDGESAVSPRWKADPAAAVHAIGEGLRALHETLPVSTCPFSWSVPTRVDAALRSGTLKPAHARQLAAQAPPVQDPVVCHGDPCAPNTLIDTDGAWAGHVDMGALGVADRWADLAVATWNTECNYGPGWQSLLLDAYGITPDPDRITYYRDLWAAT